MRRRCPDLSARSACAGVFFTFLFYAVFKDRHQEPKSLKTEQLSERIDLEFQDIFSILHAP